jgi:hypothetical protein
MTFLNTCWDGLHWAAVCALRIATSTFVNLCFSSATVVEFLLCP